MSPVFRLQAAGLLGSAHRASLAEQVEGGEEGRVALDVLQRPEALFSTPIWIRGPVWPHLFAWLR